MSYSPVKKPYLERSIKFPVDKPEFESVLTNRDTDIAIAVNRRVLGIFEKSQVTTGERWFNDGTNDGEQSADRRQSFRRVYTGTGTPANFAHGNSGITQPTRLYGMAKSGNDWIPLPYVSPTAAEQIGLSVDSTDIKFNIGGSAPSIDEWLIVFEYILS